MTARFVCTVVLTLLPLYGPYAFAQGSGTIQLTRIDQPIVLDGRSNEPAWSGVKPWKPLQYEPNNGAEPTERTEFLVAYDQDFLYLALRAFDSDPNGIRANTLYRDRLSGDDHFEIIIDTFNDNETAVLFNTTPSGRRMDSAISNDASGGGIASGGWINRDFNTFWDVETVVTPEGWFAEIRIPFSSLRFQEGADGKVVMGIAMQRKVARKTERLVFPPVRPIADWAFLKPSLAQKIVLEGIRPGRQLYVTPYGLAGLEQRARQTDDGTAWRHPRDGRGEVGGDMKIALSRNIALDLTVNTDFAQAEADDQQINLTRFSLFFPEKRQFFQERAAIFDFRTGGDSRLFHSRRIGLTDDGRPIRLLGGARLVGRVGAWDLGLLDMQSAESGALPSENFGVMRVRRQVLNPFSYAGGMVTSRVGADGSYNLAYGLDGVLRVAGDDYLTLQWAQTADDVRIDQGSYEALRSARLTAEIERRRREGVGYSAAVAYAGADYDPGLGFTQRNDFTLLDNALSYSWLPGERSSLIWHTAGVRSQTYLRNEDGSVESLQIEPSWAFAHKSGAGGEVEVEVAFEDLVESFFLSPEASVPAGSYWFTTLAVEYDVPHTDLVQWSPRLEIGSFYDGRRVGFDWRPSWFVSKHLELSGTYSYNRIRFSERDQSFDVHLARLRVGTALNTALSTNAFIQYNSAIDALSANVRFRYNLREGNDLWIVFNEIINTDRDRTLPRYPVTADRTVLVKYTYTIGL